MIRKGFNPRVDAILIIYDVMKSFDPETVPFDTDDRNYHAEFVEGILKLLKVAKYLLETVTD